MSSTHCATSKAQADNHYDSMHSLVHTGASSTQCVMNNRRRRQQSYPHSSSSQFCCSRQGCPTPSTQGARLTPSSESLLSNCDRHRPDLLVFKDCFRFAKIQVFASSQAARQLRGDKSSPAAKLFNNEGRSNRSQQPCSTTKSYEGRARHMRVHRAVPAASSQAVRQRREMKQ